MRADTSSVEQSFTTKDGRPGLVRYARRDDAAPCLVIVKEATEMRPRTIMTTTAELWSVREWRKRMLGKDDAGCTLIAEVEGTVAGLLGANRGERSPIRHIAELGITVGAAFRDSGVGRALMEGFERWARAHAVERLELTVFANNERARHLYEALGYESEGIQRRAVKFPEEYCDTIRMVKFL